MIKNLHLIIIALFISSAASAQLLNGGFENWTSAGNCSDPDNWGTLNGSTGILGICTAQQETANVHGGSSALALSTELIGFPINQIAPGIVTTGTINTTTQAVEGGQAFTERPTQFTGWYLADPEVGDNYSFSVLLINETTGDTVGSGGWTGTTVVTTWTMFSADVTYFLPDNPTMVQIILLPSDGLSPVVGSNVTFDDLDHQTVTVGVDEQEMALIRTYPNPVVEDVYFNLGNQDEAVVSIFNILGVKVKTQLLNGSANAVSMSEFSNGTYVWQFAKTDGEVLKTGKLLVIK